MKTQATQTKEQTKKKALTRRPKEEYTTFIVEVTDWELPYSLSINHDSKHFPSPYSELHGLSPFRGEAATRSIHFFKDYDPEEW